MKTLADLKRALTLGACVETITMVNGVPVPATHALRVRTVVKVQAAAIKFSGGSWLDYELAGNWEISGDTFKNIDGRQYRIVSN